MLNNSYLVPSLIQYRTTPGLGFDFIYEGELLEPSLKTMEPDASSAVDPVLKNMSEDIPSLGMRFAKLEVLLMLLKFSTSFTSVCLSLVDVKV